MKSWIVILLILFLLLGCAATPGTLDTLKNYPFNSVRKNPLENDESLVFGRVVVLKNGKALSSLRAWWHVVNVIVGPTWEEYSSWLKVTSRFNGFFFSWRLPPGEYEVLSILPEVYSDLVVEPTPLKFTVPEPGRAYFIGTLIVDWKMVSKKYSGLNYMEIKDELEEVKSLLVKRNNYWSDRVERNLMTIDDTFRPEDLQLIDRKKSRFGSMDTVYERYPLLTF